MNRVWNRCRVRLARAAAALALLAGCAGVAVAAAATPTNAPAPAVKAANAVVVVPQARFVPGGRDPFFPDSKRLTAPKPVIMTNGTPETTVTTTVVTPPPVVKRNVYDYLKIDSILSNARGMVASINGEDFRVGKKNVEVVAVIPDEKGVPQARTLKVSCLEITRRSVKIQVEGEPGPKDLFFQE